MNMLINIIILRKDFQNVYVYAEVDLQPSPTSKTVLFNRTSQGTPRQMLARAPDIYMIYMIFYKSIHLSHISQTSKIVVPFIYYSYVHTMTIKIKNLPCRFLVTVI